MSISYRMKKNGYDGSFHVSAVSDAAEGLVDGFSGDPVVPYGDIKMLPAREEPNFTSVGPGVGRSRPWYGTSDEFEERHGGWETPSELFTHVSPQIREAFVDPRLRHTLPTMVGIAMHGVNATHDVPMADSSLSRWSSALSRNAAARGLAVPHPDNPEMDSHDPGWDDEPRSIPRNTMSLPNTHRLWPDEVPPEAVKAGQQWVRSRLGQAKARRGETQFKDDPRSESQREWGEQRINPGPGQESLF